MRTEKLVAAQRLVLALKLFHPLDFQFRARQPHSLSLFLFGELRVQQASQVGHFFIARVCLLHTAERLLLALGDRRRWRRFLRRTARFRAWHC